MSTEENSFENRYMRQIIIEQIGMEGQLKLRDSTVTIVGTGGLGSPIAIYLAAAGIGTLRLIDCDVVSVSNLQRQILHWDEDLGRVKVESAKDKLIRQNPNCSVETFNMLLTDENACSVFEGSDIVISAVDNIDARFVINRACRKLGIPWVNGGIRGFEGWVCAYDDTSCCFACHNKKVTAPKSKSPIPVIGTTPGIVGVMEAQEAIKILLNIGQPLIGRGLFFDGLTMTFTGMTIDKRKDCEVCGGK